MWVLKQRRYICASEWRNQNRFPRMSLHSFPFVRLATCCGDRLASIHGGCLPSGTHSSPALAVHPDLDLRALQRGPCCPLL